MAESLVVVLVGILNRAEKEGIDALHICTNASAVGLEVGHVEMKEQCG